MGCADVYGVPGQVHAYFSARRTQTFSPEPKCSSSLVGLKSNTARLDAWHAARGKVFTFCHPGFKESLLSALSRLVTLGVGGEKGEGPVSLAVHKE